MSGQRPERPTTLEVRAALTLCIAGMGRISREDRKVVAECKRDIAGKDPFRVMEAAKFWNVAPAAWPSRPETDQPGATPPHATETDVPRRLAKSDSASSVGAPSEAKP